MASEGRDEIRWVLAVRRELDLGEERPVVQLGDHDLPELAPSSSSTVLKRSWVIGRGVSMPWSA